MKVRYILFAFAVSVSSLLLFSCVKEKELDDRVSDIVKAQLGTLNEKVDSLWTLQVALNDSLKSVQGDVSVLSKQVQTLTDSLSSVRTVLQQEWEWTVSELARIDHRLDSLAKVQADFRTEVYALLGILESRIQKIDVIPTYSDGSVYLGKKDTVIKFIVYPLSVAQELVTKHPTGDSTFTLLAIPTIAAVKSDTDADTVFLEISGVTYRGGIVSVKVNGSVLPPSYFEELQPYSAILEIRDGNSDNSSGFFPLYTPVPEDLSQIATANCYIVSKQGDYKFNATVKGNCKDSIIIPDNVSVIWESFGTSTAPAVGALVNDVYLSGGYVFFSATGEKGNALVAVKNTAGTILWSWHIWLTDAPEEQEYTVDPAHTDHVATMMDRNLGATSATKGDVTSLGLLYQWGRKDPFLGADGKTSATKALSTPSPWSTEPVKSNTVDREVNLRFSIQHPATFITGVSTNYDWYCQDSQNKNNLLWNASDGTKTIYDPCPAGWRVPGGGVKTEGGIWSKAFNADESWGKVLKNWDDKNKGMDFGATDKKLGSGVIWYPAAGCLDKSDFSILSTSIGKQGFYWSCTPRSNYTTAYRLSFSSAYVIAPASYETRAYGLSVRCMKEN